MKSSSSPRLSGMSSLTSITFTRQLKCDHPHECEIHLRDSLCVASALNMVKLTLFQTLTSYNFLFGHLTTVDHEMRLPPVVAIMISSIRLVARASNQCQPPPGPLARANDQPKVGRGGVMRLRSMVSSVNFHSLFLATVYQVHRY